jgi:hypothetical protein
LYSGKYRPAWRISQSGVLSVLCISEANGIGWVPSSIVDTLTIYVGVSVGVFMFDACFDFLEAEAEAAAGETLCLVALIL